MPAMCAPELGVDTAVMEGGDLLRDYADEEGQYRATASNNGWILDFSVPKLNIFISEAY
jgi:hypothetical protein